MRYLQSYYTDVGIKRKNNQDSLALFKADTDFGEVLLAIVCDGMGGYQSGELASKTIIEIFEKWFKQDFSKCLYDGLNFEIIKGQWNRIIKDCNTILVEYGLQYDIDLGSTLTAGLFIKNKYYIAHVGDSRAYKILSDKVFQITQDQSAVAEALRRGEITPEEAKKDKRRNILLECIGITKNVKILFYEGVSAVGDTFMFCSDGFWHNLTEEELCRYLSGKQFKDNKMIRIHLNYLVETVKHKGEKDNITALAVIPMGDNV